MPCRSCGGSVGDDGRCETCAPERPPAPVGVERPAWMAVLDLARTGLVGPIVVAAAILLGLGGELPLDVIWGSSVLAAAGLLLLGAMADHRRGAGTGTGLLAPVPQGLAAAYVVGAAAFSWDGRLVPLLLAAGAALVAWDAARRIRRGDLGPVRAPGDLRRGLVATGLLVAVAGLWGLHGTWWSTDTHMTGGYEYGYHYDSYAGEYGYSYEYSPTANVAYGGQGRVGESDAYVLLGGVGLVVAAFALVRRGLRGRGRWLPLAALAAPAVYVFWSVRLNSGNGALVMWRYEPSGYAVALAGLALAVLGIVQVRRATPAELAPPAPGVASGPPPPPF